MPTISDSRLRTCITSAILRCQSCVIYWPMMTTDCVERLCLRCTRLLTKVFSTLCWPMRRWKQRTTRNSRSSKHWAALTIRNRFNISKRTLTILDKRTRGPPCERWFVWGGSLGRTSNVFATSLCPANAATKQSRRLRATRKHKPENLR